MEKGNVVFTNEKGFDWTIDKSLTKRATGNFTGGKPINATCFLVWDDDKLLTRFLIDNKTNEVLEEYASLEAMACKIDILRFLENYTSENLDNPNK